MRSFLLGVILFLVTFGYASAQSLTVTGISGDGYFDAGELKSSLIGCMTDQAINANWTVRDGIGSSSQQWGQLLVYFEYRYGYTSGQNGQSGSGGIWCVSGGGTSVQEQQVGLLALRIIVYLPDKTILLSRQVQAVSGEKYPLYSSGGISTPYFNTSSWSYNNAGNLAQLTIQQQLMKVASAKAVQELLAWWSSPVSAKYRLVDNPSPTNLNEVRDARQLQIIPAPVQQQQGGPEFGGPSSANFNTFHRFSNQELNTYKGCNKLVIWTKASGSWKIKEEIVRSQLRFLSDRVELYRSTISDKAEQWQFVIP